MYDQFLELYVDVSQFHKLPNAAKPIQQVKYVETSNLTQLIKKRASTEAILSCVGTAQKSFVLSYSF